MLSIGEMEKAKIFLKWFKPPNVKFVNDDIPYLEIFPTLFRLIDIVLETTHNLS